MWKNYNPEFQAIFGLATGLFLGSFSKSLFTFFLFIIFYEFFVFATMTEEYNILVRIFINLLFVFGWCLSRFMFLNESGMEPLITECRRFYVTFPNNNDNIR